MKQYPQVVAAGLRVDLRPEPLDQQFPGGSLSRASKRQVGEKESRLLGGETCDDLLATYDPQAPEKLNAPGRLDRCHRRNAGRVSHQHQPVISDTSFRGYFAAPASSSLCL